MDTKRIIKFDLSSGQISLKKALGKDFLRITVRCISDIDPNNNRSHFTLSSMEKAVQSGNFYNKPILGHFIKTQNDFGAHDDGGVNYDRELDEAYYDYDAYGSERPLGVTRESDRVQIVYDPSSNVNWIEFDAVLWTKYSYRAVKKILTSETQKNKVSVEIEVLNSEIRDDGIEDIYEFNYLGTTLLGDNVGVGIPNAHLSLLDIVENQLFQQKQRELVFAYQELDKMTEENSGDDFSEDSIENEQTDEITMQKNQEKEESEVNDEENKEVQAEEGQEEYSVENVEQEACDELSEADKQAEACNDKQEEGCDCEDEEPEQEDEACHESEACDCGEKQEESCGEDKKNACDQFAETGNTDTNDEPELNDNTENYVSDEAFSEEQEQVEDIENESQQEVFSTDVMISTIDLNGEQITVGALIEKYTELENKYNQLNNTVKESAAKNLAQFAEDFINSDEEVDKESRQHFIEDLRSKCLAFELNTQEEVTKSAKGMLAMYYYELREKEKNNRAADFSVNIVNVPQSRNNGEPENKLKAAINKLNSIE